MSTSSRWNKIAALGALSTLAGVACGGGHHLAEYPFASRTLAVVYIAPPAPELLTSYYDLRSSQNPIEAVVRAGADVAREREGRRALLGSTVPRPGSTSRPFSRSVRSPEQAATSEPGLSPMIRQPIISWKSAWRDSASTP